MWRSPRRRRPGRALREVTSSPGPPAPAIPLRASCGHQAGCPLRALWGPGPPSPARNCGRKRGLSMQQCKRAHYHLLNMHEENARSWPSPITRLWPRHPIRRHIHLPRWMRRGRPRGRQIHGGGGGHVLEEKRENTRRGEPERQTKNPERHIDWDEREKERQRRIGSEGEGPSQRQTEIKRDKIRAEGRSHTEKSEVQSSPEEQIKQRMGKAEEREGK